MKSAALILATCLAAGSANSCWAQDLKAEQKFTDTEIAFDPRGTYRNFTLTITGPNRFHASAASRSGAPSIDLRRAGPFDDGTYNYQLAASTDERVPVRSGLDNGRGTPTGSMLKSVATSGQFQVKDGVILRFDPAAREEVKRQK